MNKPDIVDRIADHLLQDHVELMRENQALRQAAEQALEALRTIRPWEVFDYDPLEAAITALHAALAEPTIKESLQVPAEAWVQPSTLGVTL